MKKRLSREERVELGQFDPFNKNALMPRRVRVDVAAATLALTSILLTSAIAAQTIRNSSKAESARESAWDVLAARNTCEIGAVEPVTTVGEAALKVTVDHTGEDNFQSHGDSYDGVGMDVTYKEVKHSPTDAGALLINETASVVVVRPGDVVPDSNTSIIIVSGGDISPNEAVYSVRSQSAVGVSVTGPLVRDSQAVLLGGNSCGAFKYAPGSEPVVVSN